MTHQWQEVECIDCSRKWVKREDSLVRWSGRCWSCASKLKAANPKIRAIQRQNGLKNINKMRSPEAIANREKNRPRGSKHYNWLGGVTPQHMLIRWSKEMDNWRKSVFERDGYKCTICGIGGGVYLCADHIAPFAIFPDLRFDINNGRTLCKSCHGGYGAKVRSGRVIKEARFGL